MKDHKGVATGCAEAQRAAGRDRQCGARLLGFVLRSLLLDFRYGRLLFPVHGHLWGLRGPA